MGRTKKDPPKATEMIRTKMLPMALVAFATFMHVSSAFSFVAPTPLSHTKSSVSISCTDPGNYERTSLSLSTICRRTSLSLSTTAAPTIADTPPTLGVTKGDTKGANLLLSDLFVSTGAGNQILKNINFRVEPKQVSMNILYCKLQLFKLVLTVLNIEFLSTYCTINSDGVSLDQMGTYMNDLFCYVQISSRHC